jgi:putative ABC transport system permease protein
MFLGENWYRCGVGALLVLVCLGMGYTPWIQELRFQLLILATLFMGLTLLVPTFSHLLAALLRYPMGSLFGVEGRLASDSLVQAPRRTSATVAALMFSLAFVIHSAASSSSVKTSLMQWVDSSVNADLMVSSAGAARTFQLPSEMGEALKQIPGVRQVDGVRMTTIEYEHSAPLLLATEMEQYLRRATPLMEEGRVDDLLPGMLGKNGVLISNNLARLHHLRKGDHIALDTPTGRHTFEVVGVAVAYYSENGTLQLDRRVYAKLWNDTRVDVFHLMLEQGYPIDLVKQNIYQNFADHRNIFVHTNQDARGEILRLANQFWVLTYVQLVVAVLVAVLGIFNSLMVSISERKHEIGILRALGGERRRVRKAILLEAVCVGVVALTLGIVSGTTLSFYMLGSFGASITGWIFPYEFPTAVVLALLPGVVGITVLAAWYPAALAVKTSIAEALAYE